MRKASKGAVVRSIDPKVVEFVESAGDGNVSKVKKFIKSGKVEIDDDVDGVTALMKACGNGQIPVIEELLVAGAGMWCLGPSDNPMTPFMWAAYYGQLDVVRYFIEAVGMDEVGMNKGGGKSGHKTAMDYALDAGMHDEDTVTKKFAVLGYLSEKGATYGEGVTDPQTMFDAAAKSNVNYVHYCLEANGEMIAATHGVERSSLLHVAGNYGSLELTKNLISHGADVEARDVLDRTPLMSAATAGQVEVLRHLMDQGVTLESRDATGNTALHHACEAGHLDCVRALLSRDVPSVRNDDMDEVAITKALLDGDAPEDRPPARSLSPRELLLMKNKSGHTPIIKAFAGGLHMGVIRYVVGSIDGNVDPVKAGKIDAAAPPVLARQLSTDGIDLVPPDPKPEDDPDAAAGKGGWGVCGTEDDADRDRPRELEQEEKASGDRDTFSAYAEGTGPFPVEIAPGPATLGHRRMIRFIGNMETAVWGFDPDKVVVMSRPAVLAQTRIVSFEEAKEKRLLTSLKQVSPRAKLLYVAHRWNAPGQADDEEQSIWMQLKRYLEEPAGEGIHYVWLDASCMDVEDKEHVTYYQSVNNVITVLARATHLLAVPPCNILDPRALVREMTKAKIADTYPTEVTGELNKIPTAVALPDQQHNSHNMKGFDASDVSGIGGGINARIGGNSAARSAKKAAAAERVVDEAVDAAILSRKAQEPEKWAKVQCDAPAQPSGEADGGAGGAAAVAGSAEAGGSRVPPVPPNANGGVAGLTPKRSSASLKHKSSGNKMVGKFGGSKHTSAASEVAEAARMSTAGLSKKERKAMEEQQAKENAAAMAEKATAEVSMNDTLLAETVHYSDPAALLNRGWLEMEISLALVFGVQVQVSVRWGPKVSFQTVLVNEVMSADGEGVEQGCGFRGAFLHAVGPLSPTIEESKGMWATFKRTVWGAEPLPDLSVPLMVTYMPLLDRCHEPQAVVPPLVRAALALYDEKALLPFVAGELDPIQVMYKLSGLALQDVKDGFAGIGPMSHEVDRTTIVRLYLIGLSYSMGIVPKGQEAAGKPKWQIQKDYLHAQERAAQLEKEVDALKRKATVKEMPPDRETPTANVKNSGGCGCVVM